MQPHLLLLALFGGLLMAQQPVTIRVDASQKLGPMKPVWGFFGYDEPNFTYMQYGRKLVGELANLSYQPVHIRAHHLLCTGDGAPALKWGSTNAYTEDSTGKPVYDWKIVDRIFETYIQAGAKPFVEIGFMPEALSTNPQPYTRRWPKPDDGKGWSYPPKDYDKWRELIRQWVLHSVDRFGKEEVASWYWEVWNEPDISYWRGTPEEFNRLYDYAVDGVRRALPEAKVGGPATTGPGSEKAAAFLRQFLEHCDRGANAATGGTGAPLDFITFHAKGRPQMMGDHVRMGLAKNLNDVMQGYQIVASFDKFNKLPIVLSESDPEGCAACSARVYPQNAYRNGTLYPSYTAVAFKHIIELADRFGSNLEGILTWAFEFENQPYFDGFRTLATNGIDKPVLNYFRMVGMMRGDRVKVDSDGATGVDTILKSGVSGKPDVDAFAVRGDREVTVMSWNYHDDDVPGPDAEIRLLVAGVPAGRVLLRHFRIDQHHSNAYKIWKQMGSPPQPTPEQYAGLEAAGQLELLESPRWIAVGGEAGVSLRLPRQGVSLMQLSW